MTATVIPNVNVIDRLAELEAIAAKASTAVDQVAVARAASERAVALARSVRAEYFEAVAAHDRDADPVREQALHHSVTDATRQAEPDVWAAKEAGARRLAERREAEVGSFFAEHFEQIATLWIVEDAHARQALQRSHDERQQAEERYAQSLARWRRYGQRHGLIDAADLPDLPTRGEPGVVAERFAAGIEPPTPKSVLPAQSEMIA